MRDPLNAEERTVARAGAAVVNVAGDVPAPEDVERMAVRARRLAESRGSLRGGRPPRLVRRLVLTGAVAAVALVAVAVAPALTGFGGSLPGTPSAYAAVQKAVSKTVAAASSGTVVSKLVVDDGKDRRKPERDLDTVFQWNDDDLSLSMLGGDRQVKLVDGRFYAAGEGEKWTHYQEIDESDTAEEVRGWIAAGTRLLAAGRVGEIAKKLDGLTQTSGPDGSKVYTGTTDLKVVADELSAGMPALGFPSIDGADLDARVRVRIAVGADGIIDSWTMDFSDLGHDFHFTAEFSGIGSTGEISAPDAEQVVEGKLVDKK